jgi:hypothetical protein
MAADSRLSNDSPFLSLDLKALSQKVSEEEVDTIFHLPFSALTSTSRVRTSSFREELERPYWTVDVTDFVYERRQGTSATEVAREQMKVWGLTGWYLTMFMRTFAIHPSSRDGASCGPRPLFG